MKLLEEFEEETIDNSSTDSSDFEEESEETVAEESEETVEEETEETVEEELEETVEEESEETVEEETEETVEEETEETVAEETEDIEEDSKQTKIIEEKTDEDIVFTEKDISSLDLDYENFDNLVSMISAYFDNDISYARSGHYETVEESFDMETDNINSSFYEDDYTGFDGRYLSFSAKVNYVYRLEFTVQGKNIVNNAMFNNMISSYGQYLFNTLGFKHISNTNNGGYSVTYIVRSDLNKYDFDLLNSFSDYLDITLNSLYINVTDFNDVWVDDESPIIGSVQVDTKDLQNDLMINNVTDMFMLGSIAGILLAFAFWIKIRSF